MEAFNLIIYAYYVKTQGTTYKRRDGSYMKYIKEEIANLQNIVYHSYSGKKQIQSPIKPRKDVSLILPIVEFEKIVRKECLGI